MLVPSSERRHFTFFATSLIHHDTMRNDQQPFNPTIMKVLWFKQRLLDQLVSWLDSWFVTIMGYCYKVCEGKMKIQLILYREIRDLQLRRDYVLK